MGNAPDPYEYRLVLDCVPGRDFGADNSGASDCAFAFEACATWTPPSDQPLMRIERRPRDGSDVWRTVGRTCGTENAPAGAQLPPPVPTLGQIQEAFRRLPFGKPSVSVQPVGNVTLVNLPTFYEVTWPDAGLVPGEVSAPVQLLSWSVEFRVAAREFEFDFGDGQTSGRTTDPGGTYPDGGIRHSYTDARAVAPVRVDAWLTGEYRVNGGAWTAIDTVADLQDEPVTTLEVRSATNRLEASPR